MKEPDKLMITELTAEIVSAYVSRNSVPMAELPLLLHNVHGALDRIATAATPEQTKVEELKPAVPIKKSVSDDYIISLENGQKFKSLKRHLMTAYGMTPQQYREKWNLPKDYPMVAPAYAKSRSALAKSLGLGRKAMVPAAEAAPESAVKAAPSGETIKKPRKPRVAKAA